MDQYFGVLQMVNQNILDHLLGGCNSSVTLWNDVREWEKKQNQMKNRKQNLKETRFFITVYWQVH